MRCAILWVLFLLPCSLLKAQTAPAGFLSKNASKEKNLLEGLTARYNKDVSGLSGSNKKQVSEIYKERFELIKEKFAGNEIISDEKASGYLMQLAQEVLKANSFLNANELRILFSKAWWPNASSMGEGTILFNIGLFNRLQNESQAVFVLCHELSHYYLNHGNNAIQRYVTTINSDEFQKQLQSIKKSDYKQNQQVEALAKKITFNTRRHSREFEHAADSMAIELMKNTNYDLTEALQALALLDSVDKDKYHTPLNLSERFNFAAYPFKKSWLQSSALMFGVTKEEVKPAEDDSLKTHPDCPVRIQKLQDAVQKFSKKETKKFIISKDYFEELKTRFDFEILNYCFETKKVSTCLYYALQMTAAFPRNVYLHTLIGKCFNTLYTYQKNHELGKVTDLPGAVHSSEYNLLLRLIQNLRLQEMAAICYHYLLQFQPVFTDEEFTAVWSTSKQNFTNQ